MTAFVRAAPEPTLPPPASSSRRLMAVKESVTSLSSRWTS